MTRLRRWWILRPYWLNWRYYRGVAWFRLHEYLAGDSHGWCHTSCTLRNRR